MSERNVIAIVAPGAMGSALGHRLVEHGVRVLTSLEGRGPASRTRVEQAGMVAVSDREIAEASIILSVVPPANAVAVARRFAGVLAGAPRRTLFVDCNAVDVATVKAAADIIGMTSAAFVDAAIIGAPPSSGKPGPRLYCAGDAAPALAELRSFGIDVHVMDGPIGAASALKMSYAGITKGLTALAAAMILAATRAGASDALREELAASQPLLLARFAKALPDMYPKAYRWSGEMREIAAFLRDDPAATRMFAGAGDLYDRLAEDAAGECAEIAAIDAFLTAAGKDPS